MKTDRRDSESLARPHRAGEFTAAWIPGPEQEAMLDLTRAQEDTKALERQAKQRLGAPPAPRPPLCLGQDQVDPSSCPVADNSQVRGCGPADRLPGIYGHRGPSHKSGGGPGAGDGAGLGRFLARPVVRALMAPRAARATTD